MAEVMAESPLTSIISTRVPVGSKIKLMESAMKYRMSVGEYVQYLLLKISDNTEVLDLDFITKMQQREAKSEAEISDLRTKLEDAIASQSKYAKAYKSKEEEVATLRKRISSLEAQFEAVSSDKTKQVDHLLGKQKTMASRLQKEAKEAKEEAAKLLERLNKANKRLKDENITDGFLSGKVVQY